MYVLNILLVGLQNAIDSTYFRLIKVAIQREAVAGLVLSHEARNATEAEAREVLEVVVLLQNISHLLDCLGIIVVFATCM